MVFVRPVLLFTLTTLAVACGETTSETAGPDATPAELFRAAVEDAAVAEPDEVVTDLIAIRADNPDLEFDPDGRVLMVTWTSWSGYDGMEGESMPLAVEVWLTPSPSMQEFCRATGLHGNQLTERLEQLMGLPPNNGKDRIVAMWVPLDGMFRPSPDPEIDDSTASLEFPAGVSDEHRMWIEDLEAISYGPDGYPWTRLGYTYDWSPDSSSNVGLSEFVARAGTEIVIESVQIQDEYCK